MTSYRKYLLPLAAAVAATASPSEAATLIGDTLSCIAVGYQCSASTAVVGSGVEFKLSSGGIDYAAFDFADGILTISRLSGSLGIAGSSVTFADLTNPFSTVTYGAPPPAHFSAILDGSNNLNISLGNVLLASGGGVDLNLQTATAAVPEPESWALMIAGLAAVGMAARRRRVAVAFA